MTAVSPGSRIAQILRSPLLPIWLVPALLPFGRSAEVGVVLALVGCIGLFIRNPQALRTHDGARLYLWLLGCYVAAAAISAVDAVAPGKSWSTVASVLRYAPLGVYIAFCVRREPLVRQLYAGTALIVALWLVDAWLQALTGVSLGGAAEAERLTGVFGAENLKLGPVLATLSPFLLWEARRRWGRRGLVLAFLALLGPILLAGSRASWVAYGIVAIVFLWREVANWKKFALFAVALAAIGAAGGYAALRGSDTFDARVSRTLRALQGSPQDVDFALAGRMRIWHAAGHMIADHPFNGVGVRGFRYDYAEHASAGDQFVLADGTGAMHAHQWLLEVASETGLVGLALWFGAIGLAVRAWRRANAAARERAFAPALALVAMGFPLNTHLAFYSAWWGLVFWWLIALYCAALTADLDERGADMPRVPFSLVVTTLNNAGTLERCLASVAFADEVLVLDSGSTDGTPAIAAQHGARWHVEPFKGYSAQKQSAIDKAAHDWVLLLDADEALADGARAAIEAALEQPAVAGFRLSRRELVFWRFNHAGVRLNTHLRLFDRRRVRMNDVPVHAAPETREPTATLRSAEFLHYGEPDIHTKVSKINAYSTGLVAHKRGKRRRFLALRLVVYPWFFFWRQYLGKRWFLDGWAGFINAVSAAYYVFLKYAKLYEATRRE